MGQQKTSNRIASVGLALLARSLSVKGVLIGKREKSKIKHFYVVVFVLMKVLGHFEDLGSTFSIFGGWLFAQVGSSPFCVSYGPILFMVHFVFCF
jgi:hypothetical protein